MQNRRQIKASLSTKKKNRVEWKKKRWRKKRIDEIEGASEQKKRDAD